MVFKIILKPHQKVRDLGLNSILSQITEGDSDGSNVYQFLNVLSSLAKVVFWLWFLS